MSLEIALLVLFGALLHASWNAIVKAGSDKQLGAAMISAGAAISALPFMPFLPLPKVEALPFILASAVLQYTYFQLVAAAYRAGDIGLVYPLMRGVAPSLVALTSSALIGEKLSPGAMAGVVTISAGILTMAFESRKGGLRAILLALANACVIATYTYVDGLGARAAGNAVSYALWMAPLPPVLLFCYAFATRNRAEVVSYVRQEWKRGLAGGAGSLASYGVALYAMTKAPVASVAALRETSILFALIISVVVLKESASRLRMLAGTIIAGGALILKHG